MNAKKLTGTIVLGLTSICMLASCAGKSITRAEAQDRLTAISKVESPSTLKLTVEMTSSGDDESGTSKIIVDTEKTYLHITGSSKESTDGGTKTTNTDMYMYLKDGTYYTVDAAEDKTYSELTETLFNLGYKTAISTYKSASATYAGLALAMVSSLDSDDSSSSAAKDDGITESYHSTGEGNVTVELSQKAESTGSEKARTDSYKFVFDKNTIKSISVNVDGDSSKATFNWNSARVSYPDLSKLTKK